MILKITYSASNATDLGYLLHKNPNRPQVFNMSFGNAYVFYPEASETVTTAVLLLDVNPIDLARGKLGSRDGGLFDYVNDRPYVSSSFMSTAISKVFSTALTGRCDKKPDLVNKKLDLEVEIIMLPCSGGKNLIDRIFVPLGYETEYSTHALDEKFTNWGESKYVNLKLKGKVLLCDLLNHLYVLLPVFDNQKHYWISDEEVGKLISHGEGWLSSHPDKELITSRYLRRRKSLVTSALKMLLEESELQAEEKADDEKKAEPDLRLNDLRLQAVTEKVAESGCKSVIDLGCGEGKLLSMLAKNKQIAKITGVDVSMSVLEKTKVRIDRLPEKIKARIDIFQGSLTYKDKRFSGYDIACAIEVIEHLDIPKLTAFERVLFEFAAPPTVILTTPNAEYNVNYESLNAGVMRHSDHRFEWTREEFKAWTKKICDNYNYTVEFFDIGKIDENSGTPTQMGVFRKCV